MIQKQYKSCWFVRVNIVPEQRCRMPEHPMHRSDHDHASCSCMGQPFVEPRSPRRHSLHLRSIPAPSPVVPQTLHPGAGGADVRGRQPVLFCGFECGPCPAVAAGLRRRRWVLRVISNGSPTGLARIFGERKSSTVYTLPC